MLDVLGLNEPSLGPPLPFSFPYHGVATDAEELLNEIGGTVFLVSRYVKSLDAVSFYTGALGENFLLNAGEGYLVQVSSDMSFVPAHY